MTTPTFAQSHQTLGRSGIHVSHLGLGTWPIAGPMFLFGQPDSYGEVDDDESVRAIHAAVDAGVTFFDTADCYGAGHSEQVLGRALRGRRADVIVASKFGYVFETATRNIHGEDVGPRYIRHACRESLARLQTDYLDLFQVHCGRLDEAMIEPMADTLESLCDEGLIRAYGWSTDSVEQAIRLVDRPRFVALQHECNVFAPADAVLSVCREHRLASLARSPLAMGLLGARYTETSQLGADDVRGGHMSWVKFFRAGRPAPEFLRRRDGIRDLLASGGRTVAQGALAYIWAKSPISIPIPGFRTVSQALENAAAMTYGPLDPATVAEIDARLAAF